MKNIFKYLIPLLVISVAASFLTCSPDNSKEEQYSISFSENPVMVGADGGSCSVQVTTIHPWTAASGEGWISDVTASGTGEGALSFMVASNSLTDLRNGIITLSVPASSYTKQLTVRQMGFSGGLTILPDFLTFNTKGGTQNVTVYAANEWRIDHVSHDWITATRTNNSLLSVTAAANFTGAALSGEVILKEDGSNKSYRIPVNQSFDNTVFLGATTVMGRRFVHNTSGLVSNVTSDKQYALNDQASVLEIAYTSNTTGDSRPYSVFLADVKLENKTTLRMTTADDEDSSIKLTSGEVTGLQIVRRQLVAMQNKRSATLDVLAGVNGDYWFIETAFPGYNNLVYGIMYRGGVCIKSTFDAGGVSTIFTVMKDGTARVMTQAQYVLENKSDILEAICGAQLLLWNGVNISDDATLEPRTAVGVSKEKNRVFLLVVDGRRDNHSAGASYPMMSKMLLAMGAYDALNLDGGGSSTFVIKKPTATMPVTEDSFETHNRPSDSAGDRATPNGIAIVELKN